MKATVEVTDDEPAVEDTISTAGGYKLTRITCLQWQSKYFI